MYPIYVHKHVSNICTQTCTQYMYTHVPNICNIYIDHTICLFFSQKKKLSELEKKKEMDSLFKPVATSQKVSAGADPKSVLCVFFRQGMCSKGDKCKFSHDLSLEGKAEKRSVYVDTRDLEQGTSTQWMLDYLFL